MTDGLIGFLVGIPVGAMALLLIAGLARTVGKRYAEADMSEFEEGEDE